MATTPRASFLRYRLKPSLASAGTGASVFSAMEIRY